MRWATALPGGAGIDTLDISALTDDRDIDLTVDNPTTRVIDTVEGLATGRRDDRITTSDQLDLLTIGPGRDAVLLAGSDANGVALGIGAAPSSGQSTTPMSGRTMK